MQTLQNSPPQPGDIPAFCLFDERHNLPPNLGALYTGYNWKKHRATPNPSAYNTARLRLLNGETIKLYITGLTPALCEFISIVIDLRLRCCKCQRKTGGLILLHYDRETGTYFEQTIIN